ATHTPAAPPAHHTPSPANNTDAASLQPRLPERSSLVSGFDSALVLVPVLELGPVAVVVTFLAVLAQWQPLELELELVEPDVELAPVTLSSVAPHSSHPPPLPLPPVAVAVAAVVAAAARRPV
ncbi:hypothetical protein P691DRAFT_812570, partial [Macrolepiota fuliginosa MF-IS2]